MKHTITPEQFTENTDAPSELIDFPYRYLRMPYSEEAGGYAMVKVPDNWDGKISARVLFNRNGEGETAGAFVSLDFYPRSLTNTATGYVTADVSGSAHEVVQSNIVALDCSGCSGHCFTVKVGPDMNTTTEDAPIDVVMVELFIGTF